MDRKDLIPVLLREVMKGAVAQNTGVGDNDIHLSVRI